MSETTNNPKRWTQYDNHYELEGDGFHISYNPNTSTLGSDALTGIDYAGDQREETALCRRMGQQAIALILNGDWCAGYEERIDQGYDTCHQFYQEHKAEHQSSWSSDYGKESNE